MQTQTFSFTFTTINDLRQQLVDMLSSFGAPVSTPTLPPSPAAPAARPVPPWAPAGSTWVATPGAPMLQGPDGAVIPVLWDGATPTPGQAIVNHNAQADAQGAAVRASLAGVSWLGPLLTGPTWPIPANAPAGSQWVAVVGAGGETPTLCNASGQPLPGFWPVPPQPAAAPIGSTSSPNLTAGMG